MENLEETALMKFSVTKHGDWRGDDGVYILFSEGNISHTLVRN